MIICYDEGPLENSIGKKIYEGMTEALETRCVETIRARIGQYPDLDIITANGLVLCEIAQYHDEFTDKQRREVIRAFLDAGADVNAYDPREYFDSYGLTTVELMLSIRNDHEFCLELCNKYGASLTRIGMDGENMLFMTTGNLGNTQFLLEYFDLNINQVNEEGESVLDVALDRAKSEGAWEVVSYLISRGAKKGAEL